MSRKRKRTTDATNELVEDERFYEKKQYVFTKVWGMNPASVISMNALTENATGTKYNPLYNGISLDLVNEQPGGFSSEMDFGDHSLFKMENFHAPTLVADAVVSDPNFALMSDSDYAELSRLHTVHKVNNYKLVVYEDERYEMLTFPNYKFGRQSDGLQFKSTKFETPSVATPWWQKWTDHHIMFQVSDRLVSSKKPYDSIAFHHSSMQDVSKRKTAGKVDHNETVYSEKEMPLRPFARVYPCEKNVANGQAEWYLLKKSSFEAEVRVK